MPHSPSVSEIPSFLEFSPKLIYWQWKATYDIFNAPYMVHNPETGQMELNTQEFLFSGSVGSAKSILLCHIIVKQYRDDLKKHMDVLRMNKESV